MKKDYNIFNLIDECFNEEETEQDKRYLLNEIENKVKELYKKLEGKNEQS